MLPRRSVPVHPGDLRILEIARELCQQLGIYKFNLRFVSWVGRMGIRQIPSDYMMIYRDTMWLPRSLMQKLEPEDWRPLLASALVYYDSRQRKTMIGMFKTVFPSVLVFTLAFVLYVRFVGVNSLVTLLGSFVIIVFLLGLMIYASIHWLLGIKRLWLEADDRAVGLVGRQVFVKSLEKLQSFGTVKGPPLRLYPSIPERIRNLSKTGVDYATPG